MSDRESLFHKSLILCPRCGSEENATIWDGVNAVTDPDLKDRLLRKTLQNHVCANCGLDFAMAEPMVYHDPGLRLMIVVRPEADGEAPVQIADPDALGRAAAAVCGISPAPGDGWTLRLVGDYNHLIEKIHLADHARSDRLMEVVKVAVRRQAGPDDPVADAVEMLYLTEAGSSLAFLLRDSQGAWFRMELDAGVYDNTERLLGAALRDDGRWAVVDTAYAVDAINRMA